MARIPMHCVACAIVLAAATWAHGMDERAASIFQKSSQNILRMHSIQFSARIHTDDRSAPSAEKQFDDSIEFTYANGRMRSEVRLTDRGSGEKIHCLSLFDGTRNRLFNETHGQLVLSNSITLPNTTLLHSPLELPYSFLSRDAPATFAKLRDSSTWREMSKYATYIGSESASGDAYEKVRVAIPASPNLEGSFLVYFDPALNDFPMKSVIMVNDEKIIGRIEVRKYETRRLEDGDCVIPTEVSLVEYDARAAEAVTNEVLVSVDPMSLKLDVEFDDDLFTVATSRAEWVHDVDADTHLHVGGKVASISQDRRQRWRAFVGSLAVVGALTIVGWRLWMRKGRRRNG